MRKKRGNAFIALMLSLGMAMGMGCAAPAQTEPTLLPESSPEAGPAQTAQPQAPSGTRKRHCQGLWRGRHRDGRGGTGRHHRGDGCGRERDGGHRFPGHRHSAPGPF